VDVAVDEHPLPSINRYMIVADRIMIEGAAPSIRVKHAPGLQRTQSLTRAIALLRAAATHPGGASTAALARAAGLPVATAARLLATLADAGFVERTASGEGWVLGGELVRLARGADPHLNLVERARPLTERLADAAGESAMLAVPRVPVGAEVLVQIDAPRLLGATNWVGRRFPLHASASGKLALAELSEEELAAWISRERLERYTDHTITDPGELRAELARVRRRGYAELADELEEGLAAIAAAVRTSGGALAAMIGVSGPSFRLTPERRAELVPHILDAAGELVHGSVY
jgi:IclR family transcriptional regulator, acetate operon repressor